ncbi:hypothetical protein EMCRGX_G025128 [Ephydatia muelleri]
MVTTTLRDPPPHVIPETQLTPDGVKDPALPLPQDPSTTPRPFHYPKTSPSHEILPTSERSPSQSQEPQLPHHPKTSLVQTNPTTAKNVNLTMPRHLPPHVIPETQLTPNGVDNPPLLPPQNLSPHKILPTSDRVDNIFLPLPKDPAIPCYPSDPCITCWTLPSHVTPLTFLFLTEIELTLLQDLPPHVIPGNPGYLLLKYRLTSVPNGKYFLTMGW